MSHAQKVQSSFLAVRYKGALPKPYRWDQPAPDCGVQIIVERPGGGEEVVVVTGVHEGTGEELPQALAEVTPERLELLERRQQFEAKAFSFARQRARTRRLRIKFVRCAIGTDKKIRLFYASENTEDVRDLMRDFAREFGAEINGGISLPRCEDATVAKSSCPPGLPGIKVGGSPLGDSVDHKSCPVFAIQVSGLQCYRG